MPGKHGFGDTRKKSSQSPAYKKQKFGEATSPFKMKGSPFQRNFSLVWEILKRKLGTTEAKKRKPLVTAEGLKEQDARIKASKL